MPAPVAMTTVTLPTGESFTVTIPVELIDTVNVTGVEVVAPSTKVKLVDFASPSAFRPAVSTFTSQGVKIVC